MAERKINDRERKSSVNNRVVERQYIHMDLQVATASLILVLEKVILCVRLKNA